VKFGTLNMNPSFQIHKNEWFAFLQKSTEIYNVYVPVRYDNHIEYEILHDETENITLNVARPVTPLKTFLLPVKENVVINTSIHNKNIILGIPSCDLHALDLLDKIYLDQKFIDDSYRINRENSIMIGTDCLEIHENCYCISYGINPYPEVNYDISIASIDGELIISVNSDKGEKLFNEFKSSYTVKETEKEKTDRIQERRKKIFSQLKENNKSLPDYQKTGDLIQKSEDELWERHAQTCVSCGACTTICPTCTCFLLIDRPDFEKVRQVDACQYPGFERIAAGEDPLKKKFVRFRNRYLCKYIWRPEQFNSIACTGCGRCIDSCIGSINKNKIFIEMAGGGD
jgi:sulfhydrogenase subunit beta (sulfur reductase)